MTLQERIRLLPLKDLKKFANWCAKRAAAHRVVEEMYFGYSPAYSAADAAARYARSAATDVDFVARLTSRFKARTKDHYVASHTKSAVEAAVNAADAAVYAAASVADAEALARQTFLQTFRYFWCGSRAAEAKARNTEQEKQLEWITARLIESQKQ